MLHPVCKQVMSLSLSIINYTDQVNQCNSVHKENKRLDCTQYFRHKCNTYVCMYVCNICIMYVCIMYVCNMYVCPKSHTCFYVTRKNGGTSLTHNEAFWLTSKMATMTFTIFHSVNYRLILIFCKFWTLQKSATPNLSALQLVLRARLGIHGTCISETNANIKTHI